MGGFDLDGYLKQQQMRIDGAIQKRMPPADVRPAVLHKAMRYAVFSGGKRLRPILCLAAADAAGGDGQEALDAAVAVELLHTYTLIHDDLPCMDDDALRRGHPTCHVAFGEANAVLAGDALQALAFECAAETPPGFFYPAGQLVAELALAAGSRGVVGGQVEDLAVAESEADVEAITFIHQHKTADLFRAAVRMGAMAGNATPDTLDALSTYGEGFGLAFQIVDDLLDAGQEKPDPMSCLAFYDEARAREEARRYTALAINALAVLEEAERAPLAALAERILRREH